MSTPPTLADLRKRFDSKLAIYESKVRSALDKNDVSKLAEIRALNEEIGQILGEMLGMLAGDPGAMNIRREELVSTLNRIERDYNGLAESSDTLDRLRMIREADTGASRREFLIYMSFFILACLGLLLMMFFGGQKAAATIPMTATPASTAPFV